MTTLFVDRRGVQLALESEAIVFRENGERIGTVPLAPLERVFLRGDVQLSAALLGKLGEHGVGVVVLSGRIGKPTLLLARPHKDAHRRVRQIQKSLDEKFCLSLAKYLISRKIKSQIDFLDNLREADMQARYELTHAINILIQQYRSVPNTTSLGSLRGIEGAAAASYFNGLKALVPEKMQFKGRNRRPPRDPFNALLSLTYTMLHSEMAIGLYGVGLDPYVGFYHQIDYSRESLASDLLEPLRPLADRFALKLVRKQVLRQEDFTISETGCLLGKAGRVRYYSAYEEASETLRAAVNAEVDFLVNQLSQSSRDLLLISEDPA